MADPIEELAKKFPVVQIYEDGAKPAVKQLGCALEDIVKTIRLAIPFIRLGSILYDKYENFLDKSIQKVPENQFISPPPQILGPILENVRYEPEGTELEEIASNLLATSMDKDLTSDSHPGYPVILRQLSRDEAKILMLLNKYNHNIYYTIYEADLVEFDNEFGGKRNGFNNFRTIDDTFPKHELYYPDKLGFYINHLYHLGLAAMQKSGTQRLPIDGSYPQKGTREKQFYTITDFGKAFARACKL